MMGEGPAQFTNEESGADSSTVRLQPDPAISPAVQVVLRILGLGKNKDEHDTARQQ